MSTICLCFFALFACVNIVEAHPYNPQYTLGLSYNHAPTNDGVSINHTQLDDVNNCDVSAEKGLGDCNKKDIAKLLAATIMKHEDLREKLEEILMASDEDEDDEDEEDDDDDGHSSMLSNSAYYRSFSSHDGAVFSVATVSHNDKQRGTAAQAALAMRGGGISENEMFRRLVVAALVTVLYEGFCGKSIRFVDLILNFYICIHLFDFPFSQRTYIGVCQNSHADFTSRNKIYRSFE